MKKVLVLLLLVAICGGVGFAYWQHAAKPSTSFRTAPVKRGDLLVTISATGTVEPEEVVDVGAQVAGKIEFFGKDPSGSGKPIDYGSAVEMNTVLAHIDDSLYQADVDQADAQLEQSKANVLRSQADLLQMKAKLRQAEQNWKRVQELGPSGALAATDYDSYEATYETAKATVSVGEATVVQAEKNVVQAKAALNRAKTNLGYCTIKSPVKGVIVDRRVNIGQTVVASLNAPSLFLIAKDLKKMQVWASVNEADIGSIHPGQVVQFTVDAYPGETFRGEVGKIRLNASMTQNVVTYTVEINTDNSNGKLLPYLTANVQFEVAQHKDVLMASSGALRWMPSSDQQVVPDGRQKFSEASIRRSASRPSPEAGSRPTTRPAVRKRGMVWIQDGTLVRPVEVRLGLSNGAMTEVEGEGLEEGMELVVGESERGEGPTGTTNPFVPQLAGSRRPR